MFREVFRFALVFAVGLLSGCFLELKFFRQSEVTKTTATTSNIPGVKSPRLVIDNSVFEFGSAERGAKVAHTFILRNAGTSSLNILRIRSAARCTVAEIDEAAKSIKPGQEISLRVVLDLHLLKGPQDRRVMIECNDPLQPTTLVRMVGTVESRVKLNPERADFGFMLAGQSVYSPVELEATNGLNLNVTGVRTSGDNLSATVEPIEDGRMFRVLIDVIPGKDESKFAGWVQLLTDDEGEYSEISIPVVGQVVKDLALMPTSGSSAKVAMLPKHTLKIGEIMQINGTTLSGEVFDLDNSDSPDKRPTVVVFWASWCGACKAHLPSLISTESRWNQKGVRFVGVNLDQKADSGKLYAKEAKIPWPNIHSAGNVIAEKYGVRAIPLIVVLDEHQHVVSTSARGQALETLLTSLIELPSN